MCTMPSVKFGEILEQKRHCSGRNCGIVEPEELVDFCGYVVVVLCCGLGESVVVLAVVVSSMSSGGDSNQDLYALEYVKYPVLIDMYGKRMM